MAGAVIVREDRSNVVDYTQAFSDGYTGILIRAPDKFVDKRFIIVAKPFRWEVWALLVGFIVGTGILLKFLTRALEKETEVQYSTVGSLWIFYSVFLQQGAILIVSYCVLIMINISNQGLPIQPKSVTCRTLLAVWWLGALTLVATFTGNMVALFAVDKTKLPFDNEVEFVENVVHGEYKVVMTNSSMSRFLFLKASKQNK